MFDGKRITIKEWTMEHGQLPLTLTLRRDGQYRCAVYVKGGRGGSKAAFHIRFKDLADAVHELEKEV